MQEGSIPSQAVNPSQGGMTAGMTITTNAAGAGRPQVTPGTPGQAPVPQPAPAQQPVQGQAPDPQGTGELQGQEPPVVDIPQLGAKEEPAPVPPNSDTSQAYQYEPTGDAGLDYALNFVGELGYSAEHPAVQAAMKGDFSLIRAELARSEAKGGKEVVDLAESAYQRLTQQAQEKGQALTNFAAQAAGSAENWALVQAWASQEATPQEKAQINAALAQGGYVAEATINGLVNQYQQSHTLHQSPQSVAQPNAASAPTQATGPMTKEAYVEAVNALFAAKHGRIDGTPEYEALKAQRRAAMAAGF